MATNRPDVPADIQTKVREATLKVLQQPKVAERFRSWVWMSASR